MSRVRCQARLRLELESPFLSRGLSAAGLGIDMAQARNAMGQVVLPGDMILGNLLQACRDLGLKDAEALFGQKSEDERIDDPDSNAPRRGQINLSDLVATTPEKGGAITRVKIDDETGSVQSGALAVIELPYPLGQKVVFEGQMLLWLPEGEADATLAELKRALKMIPAVGGLKSVGFGWVLNADLTVERKDTLAAPQPKDIADERVYLTLTFDRPLLVDAERLAGNVFRGRAVIPGAVLKGALARRLERAGVVCGQDLSDVVFGHAFPLQADGKTLSHLPSPLSVVADQDGATVRDLLLEDGAAPLLNGKAPLFAIDWKNGGAVRAKLGLLDDRDFEHDTRTRTAINEKTGTSEEAQLFSYAALIPGDCRWRCELDQGKADGKVFRTLLAMLEQGLDGIGKTGATASITVAPATLPAAAPLSGQADLWAVTLRTPALLNDPDALRDGRTLLDDYKAYWAERGATLKTFFARQWLAGGYQAMRFRTDKTLYQPYLLTEPGSVFLLHGDLGTVLGGLLRSNLPIRPKGLDWRTCPFMPENGYGAFDLTTELRHV